MPKNLWSDSEAAGLDALDLLVYRSHLLGANRSVCNIYGCNTGTKTIEKDFLGRELTTLWVKGSGSDLATMTRKDFAGLRLDDVLPLMNRESMSDEEMLAYLAQCLLRPNVPRQSIETLLHAFVPAPHTDHTHPDAVISIACSADGENWARKLYGERMAWVPYIRPGFTLSKWIGQVVRDNPKIECVVMGKHGLVTWGDEPRACYDKTISIIQEAEDFIGEHVTGRAVFGVTSTPTLSVERRRQVAAEIMPVLRGAASLAQSSVLRFDDGEDVLDFVGAERAHDVALIGAACPDHLVHTKHWPLFVEWNPDAGDVNALKTQLREGVARYVENYQKYFEEHRGPNDKIFNPAPRVVLIPGVGMFNSGKDATAAQVSAELYHRCADARLFSRRARGISRLARTRDWRKPDFCREQKWINRRNERSGVRCGKSSGD
jgi:rhamnose utilization protein RhaD (predicted bifunctional aldolase and dehydrogenase)